MAVFLFYLYLVIAPCEHSLFFPSDVRTKIKFIKKLFTFLRVFPFENYRNFQKKINGYLFDYCNLMLQTVRDIGYLIQK